MRRMLGYYAKERDGVGWKWQAMDSKSAPAPLGGSKTGKNPTDRGKLGARIHLLGSMSVVLLCPSSSPAPIATTRSSRWNWSSRQRYKASGSHKEQHLCADKAYDSKDV